MLMSKAVKGKLGFSAMIGAAAPLWLWVFAAIAVGSFSLLVMYLDQYKKSHSGSPDVINLKPEQSKNNPSTAVIPKSSSGKASTNVKNTRNTQFDFYKLLPGLEAVIPEKEASQQEEAQDKPATLLTQPAIHNKPDVPTTDSPVLTKAVTESSQLFLQAGSFKEIGAADRMKASLALLGIESSIHKVKIEPSGVWHRVRVGPFGNIREMRQTKSRLQSNNIDSIMLTVKTEVKGKR